MIKISYEKVRNLYPTVDDFNFVAPGFKEISGFPSSFVVSIAINSNFN